MKTDKLCARCNKPIYQIRDIPIVSHTNVEHPEDVHYFCSRDCKLIWLAERMEKSEESEEEVIEEKEIFKCKYCGKGFEKDRGKWTHEGRCKDNPTLFKIEEFELYVPDGDEYTIKDLRKIDRILGLTDAQIARFVRGSKSNK